MAPSAEKRRSLTPSTFYSTSNTVDPDPMFPSNLSLPSLHPQPQQQQRKTIATAVSRQDPNSVIPSTRDNGDMSTKTYGERRKDVSRNNEIRESFINTTDEDRIEGQYRSIVFENLSCACENGSAAFQSHGPNGYHEQTKENRKTDIHNNNNTTMHATSTVNKKHFPSSPITMSKRRSTRSYQKRRSARAATVASTTRVKYDMELVPAVEKSSEFWNFIQTWPPRVSRPLPPANSEGEVVVMDTKIMDTNASDKNSIITVTGNSANSFIESSQEKQSDLVCADAVTSVCASMMKSDMKKRPTFLTNSVLFVPCGRQDWEDSVSEMVAICTSAAFRRYEHSSNKNSKAIPFYPPLSKEYVKDRVDIDDPLNGFQIRHATGGWLQGFLLWTNFTTWTKDFTWDSIHPQSGLATCPNGCSMDDARGSLSKELQALPRSNVLDHIVFDHVAEIALLGGLGCGEVLLRMALEEIRASPNDYRYVVLQATEGSRAFYERFGFVRIGAICRYGPSSPRNHGLELQSLPAPGQSHQQELPVQGYRHWTHANESQQSLDLHGGPSYMMCLKLPSKDSGIPLGNLIETMKEYVMKEKPIVHPLVSAASPTSRRKVKQNKQDLLSDPRLDLPPLTDSRHVTDDTNTSLGLKRKLSTSNTARKPMRKRRKVSEEFMEEHSTASRVERLTGEQSNFPSTRRAYSSRHNRSFKTDIGHKSSSTSANNASASRKTSANKTLAQKTKVKSTSTAVVEKKNAAKIKDTNLMLTASPHIQACEYLILHSAIPSVSENLPIFAIDRAKLCKQKIKSYPRDRVHFYNKVVQLKSSSNTSNKKSSKKKHNLHFQYYFVLDSNDTTNELILIPMNITSVLSGKRAGRPRYQCDVLNDNSNWKVGNWNDYVTISSVMVMKTPIVALEAWDVLGTVDDVAKKNTSGN